MNFFYEKDGKTVCVTAVDQLEALRCILDRVSGTKGIRMYTEAAWLRMRGLI